ncbi:MAG: DAK2 domain-containing protein [Oscillospiraceae bacterium]|nr:DAK2 domain-containing protein [Oscillospiraceae bacterium]
MDGKTLKNAVISGANNIINNKTAVDELNVFPVPDGDTGANMSATMKSAVAELMITGDDADVGAVADKTAGAMLRGARGNSGVILSLLFRGLSKGLAGKKTAEPKEFCAALETGVEAAYKSVMKPTEGTILTVAREAVEAAAKTAKSGGDFKEVFETLEKAANAALERTPDLLPVLKKAGVVDAGGMGYLYIIKGMRAVVDGGGVVETKAGGGGPDFAVTNAAGTYDADIEFTYCTEYLVRKKRNANDASALRAFLESIGDSVVVVDDDDVIKAHVHTENPGKALEEGLLFGALSNVKIENMKEQHKEETKKAEQQKKNKLPPASPEAEYGFVSVVSGAGLEALFTDLGVNRIVRGGQTANPSTEDILEAILATPARNVFVLPNNKNVILAAEQAQKLTEDRDVIVLQSRTVPQGVSAMLSFDPEASVRENSVRMTLALDKVETGAVTFAARDSDFEEKKIRKNDILALENGKLAFVEKDVTKALLKITKKLVTGESSYITVIYGTDVSDAAAGDAFKQLRAKIGEDIEMVLVNGGQPIYYYIVSVE